jgi:hypothetical protein
MRACVRVCGWVASASSPSLTSSVVSWTSSSSKAGPASPPPLGIVSISKDSSAAGSSLSCSSSVCKVGGGQKRDGSGSGHLTPCGLIDGTWKPRERLRAMGGHRVILEARGPASTAWPHPAQPPPPATTPRAQLQVVWTYFWWTRGQGSCVKPNFVFVVVGEGRGVGLEVDTMSTPAVGPPHDCLLNACKHKSLVADRCAAWFCTPHTAIKQFAALQFFLQGHAGVGVHVCVCVCCARAQRGQST